MDSEEVRSIVLRNTAELSELRHQVADLVSKEKRVNAALESLGRRLIACLEAFHRDKYKSTDQRLHIRALAEEIQIFDKLGYDIGVSGARFLLGVSALLDGRNQTAADHFQRFIDEADPDDLNLKSAHYLSAMISYNRRDYARAINHFEASFRLSPKEQPDWQSKTSPLAKIRPSVPARSRPGCESEISTGSRFHGSIRQSRATGKGLGNGPLCVCEGAPAAPDQGPLSEAGNDLDRRHAGVERTTGPAPFFAGFA
ncbi:MAG: tetratricopeptide repeat protein, partial [Candidatus Schekmanbacteria bacterium]|nr:tetratricopeptide repeat protein [Candidatus Schekmanbacteria bacterium]